MTPPDDYRDEVSNTEFVDQDVERLITGRTPDDPDLRELAGFFAALRAERASTPSDAESERIAAVAAEIVRTSRQERARQTSGGHLVSPGRRPSWRPARAAFALSGFFLLIAALGLGLAANMSIPGDPLYSVDLALEAVGIGNGTVDERLVEADALVAAGNQNSALILLGETYEKALANGDADGADKTDRQIISVSSGGNGDTAIAQAKVDRLRQFLAENGGPGVGLDGDEFARALQEIVNSDS